VGIRSGVAEAGRVNIRLSAATSFANIGDTARSLIAQMDAGIDYVARGDILTAESTLAKGIAQTVGVEGRDVRLLQRVVTKDGEGRLALAALYWIIKRPRPKRSWAMPASASINCPTKWMKQRRQRQNSV
jgi:hypothetical protein